VKDDEERATAQAVVDGVSTAASALVDQRKMVREEVI
jgi:hypothetical protein